MKQDLTAMLQHISKINLHVCTLVHMHAHKVSSVIHVHYTALSNVFVHCEGFSRCK